MYWYNPYWAAWSGQSPQTFLSPTVGETQGRLVHSPAMMAIKGGIGGTAVSFIGVIMASDGQKLDSRARITEVPMTGEVGGYILIAIGGYLLGSIPTAYLVVKYFANKNILEYGTGNIGTTNTLRATNSKALTGVVLAGDILKGAAGLSFGLLLAWALDLDSDIGAAIGGILAVAGHNYSLYLKFKGGKGIATSVPVVAFFAPWLIALWIGAFLLTVAATRLMVLGQILGTVVAAAVAQFAYPDVAPITYALAVLIFIRHAPRLKNVIQGTEPKLYYKIRSPEGR